MQGIFIKMKTRSTYSSARLIAMLLAVTFGTASISAALTCGNSNQSTFSWDDPGADWPDPGNFNPVLTHTESVDGVDFNFAFSSDQSNADFLAALTAASATLGTPNDTAAGVGTDTDGDGAIEPGLAIAVAPTNDLDVILDVTLSSPLSQFEFTVSDVDESTATPGRLDQVTAIGFFQGVQVLPVASHLPTALNPTTTLAGNVATTFLGGGARTPANNPEDATVLFTFNQPIDSYQLIYADVLEAGVDVGGLRGISMLTDFGFCSAPDLAITKTDNEANYTPGTPFSYDIVVTNNGVGSADGSAFNDVLPAWATGATLSCVAAGGAVCPAGTITGAGDVIPTLPDGGTVTFTVTGTYSPDMADYP